MVYVDVPFPERIAFNARAEASWLTTLTILLSGFEATNQNWAQVRHQYDAGLAVRVASDYALVKEHFNLMRGRAKSFPFTDPIDHHVAQADGVLTLVSGSNYQMHYRYGSGDDKYDRKITRPKNGAVTVYRTRSGSTSLITPTISYTTGVVTVTGHVSGDTYSWTGDFYVPCRYDIDRLPAVVVNKQPGQNGELYVECDSLPLVEVRE